MTTRAHGATWSPMYRAAVPICRGMMRVPWTRARTRTERERGRDMHVWGDRAAKFKRSTLAGRVPLTKRIRTGRRTCGSTPPCGTHINTCVGADQLARMRGGPMPGAPAVPFTPRRPGSSPSVASAPRAAIDRFLRSHTHTHTYTYTTLSLWPQRDKTTRRSADTTHRAGSHTARQGYLKIHPTACEPTEDSLVPSFSRSLSLSLSFTLCYVSSRAFRCHYARLLRLLTTAHAAGALSTDEGRRVTCRVFHAGVSRRKCSPLLINTSLRRRIADQT